MATFLFTSSDEFDYFDFARTIGGPPMTTSTTRLDLKTSWNQQAPRLR
jgi:hypothetical protein